MFGASSELASVMEFGFYWAAIQGPQWYTVALNMKLAINSVHDNNFAWQLWNSQHFQVFQTTRHATGCLVLLNCCEWPIHLVETFAQITILNTQPVTHHYRVNVSTPHTGFTQYTGRCKKQGHWTRWVKKYQNTMVFSQLCHMLNFYNSFTATLRSYISTESSFTTSYVCRYTTLWNIRQLFWLTVSGRHLYLTHSGAVFLPQPVHLPRFRFRSHFRVAI